MTKIQATVEGATEDFVVTREFREISTMEQRLQLLRCCFAIEAADGTINAEEASVVNEIARELDIERRRPQRGSATSSTSSCRRSRRCARPAAPDPESPRAAVVGAGAARGRRHLTGISSG